MPAYKQMSKMRSCPERLESCVQAKVARILNRMQQETQHLSEVYQLKKI